MGLPLASAAVVVLATVAVVAVVVVWEKTHEQRAQ
jgi:hypothetical protein